MKLAKRKRGKQPKKFALTPVAAGVASALLCNMPASVTAQTELEEIIVTATRRAETVLDIPYNLSVLSNDDLRTARAIGLGDLARLVPGVSYVDQGPVARAQNNNFTLRGLNISSASNNGDISALSQAAVSTYVGETPIFYNITLKDMDRVEVLRGPQGTLYGAGSLGGTIRFIPNRPDFSGVAVDFDSSVSLTEDSDQVSYSADGVINLPVVENVLAARIAAGYTREGGFVDALGPPRKRCVGSPGAKDCGRYFQWHDHRAGTGRCERSRPVLRQAVPALGAFPKTCRHLSGISMTIPNRTMNNSLIRMFPV